MKVNTRARHEVILHGRLKMFKILSIVHCGDRNKHHMIFNAITFFIVHLQDYQGSLYTIEGYSSVIGLETVENY